MGHVLAQKQYLISFVQRCWRGIGIGHRSSGVLRGVVESEGRTPYASVNSKRARSRARRAPSAGIERLSAPVMTVAFFAGGRFLCPGGRGGCGSEDVLCGAGRLRRGSTAMRRSCQGGTQPGKRNRTHSVYILVYTKSSQCWCRLAVLEAPSPRLSRAAALRLQLARSRRAHLEGQPRQPPLG